MSVIWEIESDDCDHRIYVEASSNAQAVTELLARGFTRILKDYCPYQDEPLCIKDSGGMVWSAMPANFNDIKSLKPGDMAANLAAHRGAAKEAVK